MEKPRLKKNKNEEGRIIERERGENKQKKQNHTQREKEEERGWERRGHAPLSYSQEPGQNKTIPSFVMF